MKLRTAETERFIPDVGNNRELALRGDPEAIVVELTPPTYGLWRQYQARLTQRRIDESANRMRAFMKEIEKANPNQPIPDDLIPDDGLTDVPMLDGESEGPLFCACVGKIEGLSLADGTKIESGEALWALRHRLEREVVEVLFASLIGAILRRAELDAGTLKALALRSGSPASPSQIDGVPAGAIAPAVS